MPLASIHPVALRVGILPKVNLKLGRLFAASLAKYFHFAPQKELQHLFLLEVLALQGPPVDSWASKAVDRNL